MTDTRIVLTTTGSNSEAEKIANSLVERQLAACVNIVGPIRSIYRWEGKVESAAEHLLVIKTIAKRFEAVRNAIRELHSYDLPECIELNIENGSTEYLDWIASSVK